LPGEAAARREYHPLDVGRLLAPRSGARGSHLQ
jgi:hypothetical protein